MKKTERFIGACSKYIDKVGWTTDIPVDQINEKGYVKVENGSVVFQQKDLTKLQNAIIQSCNSKFDVDLVNCLNDTIEEQKQELAQARKKTVKEILSLAIKHDNGYETDMTRFISDLKKQYGVEE